MKKRIALLAVACMMFATMGIFAACGEETPPPSGPSQEVPAHTHQYGDWTIETKPTQTAKGSAKRTCTANDDTQTLELPVLTDVSFWTEDTASSQAPTHTAAGKDVYKNAEYNLTVEVELPANADAHSYGAWSWKNGVEPTLGSGATATRSCTVAGCTDPNDEAEVPALNDTTVWEKSTTKAASHIEKGQDTYTSEYGTVIVETDKVGEHRWGAWSWVTDNVATETKGGKAEHSCTVAGCRETEQVDVTSLSTTADWDKEVTEETYNEAGKTVYTHKTYTGLTHTIPGKPKKEAPYDGKTYYGGIAVDITKNDGITNGVPSVMDNWGASITLDETGTGIGEGSPFSTHSKFHFTVKDVPTGELEIIEIEGTKIDNGQDDDDGGYGDDEEYGPQTDVEYEYETATPKSSKGYVDLVDDKGLIIKTRQTGTDLSYFEIVSTHGVHHNSSGDISVKLSSWGTSKLDYSVAITYTYKVEQETYSVNIYLHNDVAVFGVTFEDIKGDPIAAENCYNAAQLYVKKGGKTLAAVGYNGTTMVELDGLEGTYTLSGSNVDELPNTLTLNGVSTATFDSDKVGSYKVVGDNVVGITVDGAYYEATLNKGTDASTYTLTKPVLNVIFDSDEGLAYGDSDTLANGEYNKNIEVKLPVLNDTQTHLFRGWYTTDDFQDGTMLTFDEDGYLFTPTGDEEITLYAKWAQKITIKVHPAPEAETEQDLVVGVGDNILESLQTFDTSPKNGKVFRGWYTLSGGHQVKLSAHPTATYTVEHDNTLVLYSEWIEAPYIGEYQGANLDSTGSKTASTSKTRYYISISEDGSVDAYLGSSHVTGTVTDYSNGIITITSGSDTLYFFFDELSGLLVTAGYNSAKGNYIGYDIGGYSRTQKTFNQHPIMVPNPTTSGTSQEEYARFVEMDITVQNDGADPTTKTILVLLYNTKIYSDITVTDAFGEELTTIDAIKASKTIIVTDNSSETQILAKGSVGDNLGSGDTADLDQYYGTYTGEGDELKLDGAGTLLWGEKEGTYTAAPDGSSYTFDVYVTEDDTRAYYELTVDTVGKTYTLEKIDVNVTLNKGEVGEDETKSYNKNIEFQLPNLTDLTGEYLFRGWYSDAAFEHALTTKDVEEVTYYYYTPTEEVTLYAKWVKKVTVTVHYNDGTTENTVIENLGDGETLELERPTYAGHKFGGWYTDDKSFEQAWGTMGDDHITSGALSAETATTLDLYAKWEGAPAYSGEYKLYYLDGNKLGGGVDTAEYKNSIAIDAEGYAPKVSGTVYPFSSSDLQVQSYDAATGAMVFLRVGYTTTFNAFFDSAKKIIAFVNYSDDILLMIPADAGDVTVKSSYWGEEGGTRAINVTIGEESYNIFVINDTVYFGVTFVDKDGGEIAAEEAYNTKNRFYVKKDGEAIEGVKGYGYNGTTMVELDGYEGEYTYSGVGADTEVDFGKIEIDGVGGLTTAAKKTGTYTLVSGKDYTAELRLEGLFYYLTLTLDTDTHTYSVVKPMATVTFTLVDGTDDFDYEGKGTILSSSNSFPANGSYNLNTQFAIENVPEVEGYVFRGWYTASGDWYSNQALKQDESGNYIYTPTEMTVTLYARFVKMVTVEIHYQKEGVEDKTLEVGYGEAVTPPDPGYVNGEVFKAWHLGTSDGNEWEAGTVVKQNIVLYFEWQPGVPLFGSYAGTEIHGFTDKGGAMSGGSLTYSISVSADGTFSGQRSGAMTDWNPETGTFKVGSYYGAIDLKNGVMIVDYSENSPIGNDYYIVIKNTISGSFKTSSSAACYWNGFTVKGSTKLAEMTLADGSKMNIFIYEGRVWGKVTFEGTPIEGFSDALTAGNVWQKAQTLVVKDSDGKVIASFVRGANGLEYSDGLAGTYTGDKGEENQQDLILDGKGKVTSWSGRQGTYSLQDGVENGIELYLEANGDDPAEYWTVVVDKSGQSYTATMPMVELTLILRKEDGSSTLTTVNKSVNKNIPVALSETYQTYVSAGWYTDESLQEAVALDANGLYKPTEATTLYAKMVEKVTLTIVYGTEHGSIPNAEIELPKGSTPDLTKYVPAKQGNYVFGGWYEDEACTETPYAGGPLTESKTIYCKWIEQQYKVDNSANEWTETEGTYRATKKSTNHCNVIAITFNASGKFTFNWTASFSDSYDGINVALNNPNPHQANSKVLSKYSGSGVQTVDVKAGDVLYIGAYWDSSGDSASDYATVSNFSFVAD